jgi:hypothetical protein
MKHDERVRVYRNLTAGNWSIQIKTDKGWRVRGHATSVELLDADCNVSDAGRARVLREQCKNVHAYIEGNIDFRNVDGFPYGDADLISYNPYEAGTFTTSDGEPVAGARRVRFNPNHSVFAVDINRGLQST